MLRKRFLICLSATALFLAACDDDQSSDSDTEEVDAEELDEDSEEELEDQIEEESEDSNDRKHDLIENFDPEEYMTGHTHTDLMRNPDDMQGERVYFIGEVTQVLEEYEEGLNLYLLSLRSDDPDNDRKQVFFVNEADYTFERIIEGDRIWLYGEYLEEFYYDTVSGRQNSEPLIYTHMYTIQEN